MSARLPASVALRHPTEADQPRVAAGVDEWFAGRRVRHLVGRAWFRHFGSTSWLAEGDTAGEPIGFVVGYRSQDHPTEGIVHLLAVHPNHRRRGIGRALAGSFLAEAADAGIETVTALAWPDEPVAIAFFRAIGFRPDDGPGTQKLYGTPAFPDFEAPGEDRVVLVHRRRTG